MSTCKLSRIHVGQIALRYSSLTSAGLDVSILNAGLYIADVSMNTAIPDRFQKWYCLFSLITEHLLILQLFIIFIIIVIVIS